VSDYKNREFGKKYGFLIDGIFILARGLIILDENNNVIDFQYVPEITKEPNYDLITKNL
jgi:thiol peroxidase